MHGFGGSPATFGPVRTALAEAGVPVRAVSWSAGDASWAAWVAEVERAVVDAGRGVVVVGQSAGAALALAVAVGRPELVESVIVLNPLLVAMDDDTRDFLDGRLDRGVTTLPAEPVAIVDPVVVDPDASTELDLAGLLALHEGLAGLEGRLADVAAPVHALRGIEDEVVGPEHLDALLAAVPQARMSEIPAGTSRRSTPAATRSSP